MTITAHASPAANAVGWNNTDVTVTFSCTNATVCPQAMLVSAETAAQVLTGTASNADHSATVSVTVKVDKTAPTLTLSAPASIPAGIVSMSGTVAESLSGLASTSCNGAGVTASNGSITCVVPITYGNNSMALQATDLAGNVASIGGHVFGTGTPTSLRISPPTRTLLVGESIGIQVLDDAGITPPSLTWSVADQAVASVNSGTVTATSAGTTTITAAAGGLSAQLTITVVNGASLPVGTARWTTQASPGSDSVGVVGVLGIDESTVLASVESVWDSSIGDWGGYSHSIVRGLSESGEATFSINPGLASNEVPTRIVGDSTGGLLMLVLKYPTTQAEYDYDALQGGHPVSLVRVSPVPDSIWRYPLGRAASGTDYTMAEGDDGTIYIVGDRGTQLVAVDRQTGATRFRRAAPLQVFHYYSDTCPQLNFDTSGYNPALWPFSEPRVDANGVVNTLVVSREGSVPILVSQNGSCQITGYGQSQFTQTVSLHRVSSDGTAQVIALGQYSDHGITTTSGEGGYVLPDDTGGVLTSWLVCSVPAPNQQQCQRRARHVSPAGLGAEFDLTEIPSISGTDSVAYDSAGAISMVTGLRLWSKIPSTPVAALENGETQYGSYGAATAVFDASGNVLRSDQSLSFDVDGPTLIRGNMQFGWTPDHSAFTALVADERYIDPDGGFQTRQGNARKTNSRVSCVPKPAWWSNALTTPRDYQFAFDDEIPGFPTAASFGIFFATERSFFLPEFVKWQFGGDRGFPNAITRLTSGTSAANLVVSAGDFLSVPPSRVNLYSAAAVTLFPASMYPTTSLSADYRSAAAVGAFPSNRFGIIVQKDYATATDAAHASYLKFVALHEFGHVIGLGHSEQVCRPSRAAMTQRARSLTDHVTAPTELDKKALRKQLNIQ